MILTVTLNPSLDEWVFLPRLRIGELNRSGRFLRYPGGKGINVSRVVHELRRPTLAIAVAGGGDGRMLEELLDRYGIPHQFLTVAGSTRNNYQIQTQTPHALTQINGPGPRVSARDLARVERMVGVALTGAGTLVLSGSLPPGAPASTYARFVRRGMARSGRVVLDASGDALRLGLRAKPWLIKPNRQEAGELLGARLGTTRDVLRAARRLTRMGPQLAIISLGKAGAVLAARDEDVALVAASPTVPVNSPVGAGDSLVAGFVVGFRRTGSLVEAFRLGVACGAAAAMTAGTELCRRRDVQRLVPKVRIRRVG